MRNIVWLRLYLVIILSCLLSINCFCADIDGAYMSGFFLGKTKANGDEYGQQSIGIDLGYQAILWKDMKGLFEFGYRSQEVHNTFSNEVYKNEVKVIGARFDFVPAQRKPLGFEFKGGYSFHKINGENKNGFCYGLAIGYMGSSLGIYFDGTVYEISYREIDKITDLGIGIRVNF